MPPRGLPVPESPTRPPNIVVILADDLGFMDIRPDNPDSLYDTPNLERLAASGTRFTNGYATCPVCSPTRYSMLTGRYPARSGLTDWLVGTRAGRFQPAQTVDRMALDEVTLAEVLRERGYATFFAGKWHLGPTAEYWPQAQGFDVNKGGWVRGGPYGGDKYFSPYGNPQLEDGPKGEHLPDRLARETAAFIAAHKDQPFLAYLSFYSVHTPLMGRADLVKKYEERVAALRRDGAPEFADEEQTLPDGKPRKVRTLQRHAVYAAMVEAMDQAVGVVLDAIEAQGLGGDTIVVFTSDNGGLSTSEGSPTSNLPLRGGKGWLYEGGIREPWLVRVPGVTRPGSVSAAPICSADLLPTVLDLLVAPPVAHEIDGISFASALRGEPMPSRPLFWHYPHYGNQGGFPGGAVRLGDWKLIERYEDGRVQLYHLSADPGERTDLAEEQPERVAKLRALLRDFQQQHHVQFLRAKDGVSPWRPEQD
ncbi:MAG: sulfatase [Planctomycetes bacterium]|nr:sulfatase [Planctomycetota bacterium]MCB9886106.1 sulfatase [Planctomycetota bacterium]